MPTIQPAPEPITGPIRRVSLYDLFDRLIHVSKIEGAERTFWLAVVGAFESDNPSPVVEVIDNTDGTYTARIIDDEPDDDEPGDPVAELPRAITVDEAARHTETGIRGHAPAGEDD